MIVFSLECKICDIKFEGWFESTTEYNKQKKQHMITCPSCGSSKIKKSLMSPNISKKSNTKDLKVKKSMATNIAKYKKVIEKNFDYVGEKFTEEAKKMKYGEKDERPIYGEATIEQTKELVEEDINVVPLPWAPNKKNN